MPERPSARTFSQLEDRIQISASRLLIPCPATKKSMRSRISYLGDFLGQALSTSTQACFNAIAFDREEQIKKMFSPLFQASLAAFDRL